MAMDASLRIHNFVDALLHSCGDFVGYFLERAANCLADHLYFFVFDQEMQYVWTYRCNRCTNQRANNYCRIYALKPTKHQRDFYVIYLFPFNVKKLGCCQRILRTVLVCTWAIWHTNWARLHLLQSIEMGKSFLAHFSSAVFLRRAQAQNWTEYVLLPTVEHLKTVNDCNSAMKSKHRTCTRGNRQNTHRYTHKGGWMHKLSAECS